MVHEMATSIHASNVNVNRRYAYWRLRLTYTLIVGYAAYYIVRQNFTMLKTSDKCPFSIEAIGWAFSGFSIVYGLFKFIAGSACDRSNSRFFMPIGLALAGACSLLAGCCESAIVFGFLYAVSAIFQSMGWPSVSRILTQWFGPRQIGTRWGVVNSSHQVGSVIILMGGAWLLQHYSWRYLFIVPACICFLIAIWTWERLRDRPELIGLPTLEDYEGLAVEKRALEPEISREAFSKIFKEHILLNYRLWIVCAANFFVYFVRSGLLCWGPVMITKTQNCTILEAGSKMSSAEIGGIVGGLWVGWFTDRFMPKRRGLCGSYMMILLGVIIGIYWVCNTILQDSFGQLIINNTWIDYIFWFTVGFLMYGPQVLGGLSGAEFGSKKAAATGAGLTGVFGYLAASVSGIGLAKLSEIYGWQSVYLTFVFSAFLGGIFFAMTLRSPKKGNV